MHEIFSHADETHETITESTSHFLGIGPGQAVVFAILVAALIVVLTQLIFHKPTLTTVVALASLFIVGVFSYSVAPVVSAICIIAGFALSLFIAFIGIIKG